MKRLFHPPKKHPANPVLTGDHPGFLWALRDEKDGLFRLWYQINTLVDYGDKGRQKGQKAYNAYIAFAQSKDGIHWDKPELAPAAEGSPPRNVVLGRGAKHIDCAAPQILEVPARDRRDYRYLMMYRKKGPGIHLIGSHDGLHFDDKSETLLCKIPSDHHNTVVYDPRRQEYVMYLRAKHIYPTGEDARLDRADSRRDRGQSRRGVARMTSKTLWDEWTSDPQTVVTPDEIDDEKKFSFFYGMPTHYYAGIYWGGLELFRWNDFIYTEMAWSRDGMNFERLPGRPKLIEYGPEGSWDDEMIFASPRWVEVGDEWWFYYSGWDGPHGTEKRTGGIGLATFRKEGLISQHGPKDGGVVCTRALRWPGGALRINADASKGELRVRVSDARRKPLAGFNYDDAPVFSGNHVAHEWNWKDRSLASLKGQVIRLEFLLKDADLYTFRAAAGTT